MLQAAERRMVKLEGGTLCKHYIKEGPHPGDLTHRTEKGCRTLKSQTAIVKEEAAPTATPNSKRIGRTLLHTNIVANTRGRMLDITHNRYKKTTARKHPQQINEAAPTENTMRPQARERSTLAY
jgi:hypothetical protein